MPGLQNSTCKFGPIRIPLATPKQSRIIASTPTMKIDSHQHFWTYSAKDYPWITDALSAIKRSFSPDDLEPLLKEASIDGSIAVQARQSLEETRWLLQLAEEYDSIKGVVGWLPLQSQDLEDSLDQFASHPKLVGVRHVVQDETDDQFILRPDFNRGIRALAARDLVYDILIFERHLPQTITFVDTHPEMPFVLDHIAKPVIQEKAFDSDWARNIRQLAKRENVACKLSGMVTEVRDETWDAALLQPYFDTALDAFGPDRLLFGSDWPVCRLRASYAQWVDTVHFWLDPLSNSEKSAIWGENAQRLYNLA